MRTIWIIKYGKLSPISVDISLTTHQLDANYVVWFLCIDDGIDYLQTLKDD